MRLLQFKQDVPSILPSDLVSDPVWPLFKLGQDITKSNNLVKFQHAQVISAASRVLTMVPFIMA